MNTLWVHLHKNLASQEKINENWFFLQILYYVMSTSSVIWQSWRGLETRNKKRERSSQERSKARKSCLRFLHVYIISNVTLSRSISKKSYGFWHPALVFCPWDYTDIYLYIFLILLCCPNMNQSWFKNPDRYRTLESLTFQHFFHEPTFHSVFYKLILCYFSVAIRVHSFPGQKCTVDMLWSRISLVGVMRFLNPVLLSKLTI